jgi:hypothetical protein
MGIAQGKAVYRQPVELAIQLKVKYGLFLKGIMQVNQAPNSSSRLYLSGSGLF